LLHTQVQPLLRHKVFTKQTQKPAKQSNTQYPLIVNELWRYC